MTCSPTHSHTKSVIILVIGSHICRQNDKQHTKMTIYFLLCGAPQILLTDQGKNFESKLIAELCDLLQIDKRRTTAYHPQCDGQVERFNRTLTTMLSMYVEKNQKDWDRWLPQVLLAYRSSVHESTGATPFALLYGREARLPVDLCFPCPTDLEPSTTPTTYQEYTATLQTKLNDLFSQARGKLQLSQKTS